MTATELTSHFEAHRDLPEIRDTDLMARLCAALPTEPGTYVRMLEALFAPHRDDLRKLEADQWWGPFERLMDIIRELHYFDGRAFEALLYLCDLDLADPHATGIGMDATAAIACFVPPNGGPFGNDQVLLQKMEPYLASGTMRHNIRGIRQKILRRSPDVVCAPDEYPP